jgi:hypothetical protein
VLATGSGLRGEGTLQGPMATPGQVRHYFPCPALSQDGRPISEAAPALPDAKARSPAGPALALVLATVPLGFSGGVGGEAPSPGEGWARSGVRGSRPRAGVTAAASGKSGKRAASGGRLWGQRRGRPLLCGLAPRAMATAPHPAPPRAGRAAPGALRTSPPTGGGANGRARTHGHAHWGRRASGGAPRAPGALGPRVPVLPPGACPQVLQHEPRGSGVYLRRFCLCLGVSLVGPLVCP